MCLFGGLEAIDYLAVKRKENLHLCFLHKIFSEDSIMHYWVLFCFILRLNSLETFSECCMLKLGCRGFKNEALLR